MAIDTEVGSKDKRINLLDRGFKSRTENLSAMIRSKLSIAADEPLPYQQLAEYLSVDLKGLRDLDLAEETKTYLASSEGDEWSAITVASPTKIIVIVNPSHSPARKSSDIMHELSHVILEHAPSRVYITDNSFALRDYNDKQEAEANWLAGALLLPRVALEKAQRQRISETIMLATYSVSSKLYRYRVGMTGISSQYRIRR